MNRVLLFIVVAIFYCCNLYSQSYSHNSGEICSAYSFVSYTFPNTPETQVNATLDVSWLYCGPYLDIEYGDLEIDIWINDAWVEIANISDFGSGCSWDNDDTIEIETSQLNSAINTSGGSVTIRVQICDECPGGYGCICCSDPCFNATLSYDPEFDPCTIAPCFFLADIDNDGYIGTPDILEWLSNLGCVGDHS